MKKEFSITVYVNDPLGDIIARIRNKHMMGAPSLESPSSSLRINFLKLLKEEGYIEGYKEIQEGKFKKVVVKLKYFRNSPVIKNIKRISTPGRRIYARSADLKRVCNGLGISIVSTSAGLMTDFEARRKGLGGELLCEVV